MIPTTKKALAVLVLSCALVSGSASWLKGQQTSSGPTLAGRVARADTGAPVENALVRLTASNGVVVGNTRSTESGEFTFAYVRAGEYRLSASAAGLVCLDATPIQPQGGRLITLSEGQQLGNIELGLVPMLTIEGRVVDQRGAPVEAVQVSLAQVRFVLATPGVVSLATGKVVRTEPDGRYRFVDVPPGDYYVLATGGPFGRVNLSGPSATPVPNALLPYVPTYFPGTERLGGARPVRVEIGMSAFDVSFALISASLVAVTGTVVDANGQPAPNVTVLLSQAEAGQTRSDLAVRTASDANGRFAYRAIPAGTYMLEAFGSGGFGARSVTVPVQEELAGVDIAVRPPIRARGRVRFEGGGSPAGSLVRIRFVPTDFVSTPLLGVLPTIRFEADGTFEIGPLSWNGLIRVDAPPEWALTSVLRNGREISDEPSDFRSADVDGLELVMTNRLASISGTVTDANGPAASLVLVLPEDVSKRLVPSRFPSATTSASDGTFKFTGVPPGRYRVIAINLPTTYDADWSRNLHSLATPVIVSADEPKAVALKLVWR